MPSTLPPDDQENDVPSREPLPESDDLENQEPRPPFHPLGTVVFTWLLLLFGVFPSLSNLFTPAEQTVELRPRSVQAAIRITERKLAASALRTKELLANDPAQAMSTFQATLDHSAEVYSSLIDIVKPEERLDLLARRAVIEAERGERQAAKWALSALDESAGSAEFKASFAEAYEEEGSATSAFNDGVAPKLPTSGWTRNSLLARLAKSRGKADAATDLGREILADGQRLIDRQASLRLARLSVVPLGLLALFFWWRRSFKPVQLGIGLSTPPWDHRDGLAVIVRSVIFGMGLATFMLLYDSQEGETTIFSWGGLWLSLPMFYFTTRYLLKPHGLRYLQTFGLSLVRKSTGSLPLLGLLGATCLLLSAQQLSLEALAWINGVVGLVPRWNDFLIPDLVLGDRPTFGVIAVDELLFGPLCLELAFRGLLYQNLRLRMGIQPAALLSAVLFALFFITSFPSFVGVVCIGYLWSLSYEYTRSLIPGIICHVCWNASTLAILGSYR